MDAETKRYASDQVLDYLTGPGRQGFFVAPRGGSNC